MSTALGALRGALFGVVCCWLGAAHGAVPLEEISRTCAGGEPEAGLDQLREQGLLGDEPAIDRSDYARTIPVIADCYAAATLYRQSHRSLQAGIRRAEAEQQTDTVLQLREKLGRVLLGAGVPLPRQRGQLVESSAALDARIEFELVLAALPPGDERRPSISLAIAAAAALAGEETAQLGQRYRVAMESAEALDDLPVLVQAQLGLYRVLRTEGQPNTKLLNSSREVLARLPAATYKAPLQVSLGDLFARIDEDSGSSANRSTAIELLRAGADSAANASDRRTEAEALGGLGRLAERANDWDRSLAYTRLAAARADEADALDSLYQWQWQIARIQEARGQTRSALSAYEQALGTLQSVRSEVASGTALDFGRQVQPLFYDYASLLLQSDPNMAESDRLTPRLQQVTATIEKLREAEILNYFDDECVVDAEERLDVQNLDAGAAVFYPIIFDDRLEVLVTSGGSVSRYTAKVTARELNRTIKGLRDALQRDRTRTYELPARQLYDWLVRPAIADLRARGINVLVFVPDGLLRTIPPAALYDGERFLIEDFAVAVTPGLTVTSSEGSVTSRATATVLAGGLSIRAKGAAGDGTSDGLRGADSDEFPELPAVTVELDRIGSLFPTRELRDAEFLKVPVEQELAGGNYSIVHIATHGKFERDFRKSYLLTYDGQLTLDALERTVSSRRYLNEPVDLLVLSACQTAQGDERAALGLAGVALKAGARSAVATLWNVNDAASAALIGKFYEELRDQQVSKAEALRRAQVSLLRTPERMHPGLWSPYLLIGSWL